MFLSEFCCRSHFQATNVWHASLHHFELHLDEVVLDSSNLRRGENLLPVERILPDWRDLLCGRSPSLHVHRNEPSRIFREIFSGIKAVRNSRNLELKLHELRIQLSKQDVVGPLAIDAGKLESFVMQPLLNPCFC